jgi:pilus assembly protein CpaB
MKKRLIPLALAGLLGLSAVALIRNFLMKQRQALEQEKERLLADYRSPIEVIAAIKDLPEGTALTKEHLGFITIPEKFVQPYATQNPQDLVGKVTLVPIAEGEQVLMNKVRRPEEVRKMNTLSTITPEGKRAITISVDQITGVGGMVTPGDMVDVLWNFQAATAPGAGGGERQLVTVILFQHVQVLAIDHQLQGRPPPEGGAMRAGGYTATLALHPQEAAMLLFAREQGRIQLSLRSKEEVPDRVAVTPTTMGTLTEAILGKPPQPEPPKVTEQEVEVYKGLERSVVAVSNEKE